MAQSTGRRKLRPRGRSEWSGQCTWCWTGSVSCSAACTGTINLLQFERRPACFSSACRCGHESPGWETDRTPPVAADRRRTAPSPTRKPCVARRCQPSVGRVICQNARPSDYALVAQGRSLMCAIFPRRDYYPPPSCRFTRRRRDHRRLGRHRPRRPPAARPRRRGSRYLRAAHGSALEVVQQAERAGGQALPLSADVAESQSTWTSSSHADVDRFGGSTS